MKDNKDQKLQKEISNLLLCNYKDDAYGRLQELHDIINNSAINAINEKEEKELFFEIDIVSDEAKGYAMRTKLETWKLDNIYRMLAAINKVKNNIDSVSEKEFYEYKNAFDFELKSENTSQQKEIKYVERAFEIEKKIDEACKAKNKKTPGNKSREAKELSHYIIKDWNENGKKLFANKIKTKYKDYGEDYKNGNKQKINLLALVLVDLNIMKTPNKKIQFETVLKAIIGKDTISTRSDQSNFATLIRNGYKSIDEYKNLKEELPKIFGQLAAYRTE